MISRRLFPGAAALLPAIDNTLAQAPAATPVYAQLNPARFLATSFAGTGAPTTVTT